MNEPIPDVSSESTPTARTGEVRPKNGGAPLPHTPTPKDLTANVEQQTTPEAVNPAVVVDVVGKGLINPLFIPQQPAGDQKRRTRKPRVRPAFIRDVRAHIAGAWRMKHHQNFRWNELKYENVRTLMRVYQAWEIMAMWDLWLERPGSNDLLYFMQHRSSELMSHPQFKTIASKYETLLCGNSLF